MVSIKSDTFCLKKFSTDKKQASALAQMKKQMEQELTKQNNQACLVKAMFLISIHIHSPGCSIITNVFW